LQEESRKAQRALSKQGSKQEQKRQIFPLLSTLSLHVLPRQRQKIKASKIVNINKKASGITAPTPFFPHLGEACIVSLSCFSFLV